MESIIYSDTEPINFLLTDDDQVRVDVIYRLHAATVMLRTFFGMLMHEDNIEIGRQYLKLTDPFG